MVLSQAAGSTTDGGSSGSTNSAGTVLKEKVNQAYDVIDNIAEKVGSEAWLPCTTL